MGLAAKKPLRSRRHALCPGAECLEDRMLLYATLGGQWAHASRITYSFAPDGTSVGGTPSAWVERMNALGLGSAWQEQFRQAASFWQYYAGVNLVEVPDDGTAFAASGNQQGDSRFGDIRIAGIAQDAGMLGASFLPPAFNGGTLAGDIVMNTEPVWQVGGTYDLRTVALHEFGHALGLDHSAVNDAVMHATYTGLKQTPRSDDIAGIRAVYGPRAADAFEGAFGNNVYLRSTVITGQIDGQNQIRLAGLDIQSASDNDWFYVVAPAGAASTMTVTMQSSGLSSLSPRLMVYNAQLQGLAQVSSTGYGGTVTASIGNVRPGQGFFIRAMPATTLPTGAGSYGLLVNLGSSPIEPIAPPNTVVPEQPDLGGGSIYERSVGRGKKHHDPVIQVGTLRAFGDELHTDLKGGGKRRDLRLSPGLADLTGVSLNATMATIPLAAPGVAAAASWLDPDDKALLGAIDTLLDRWFAD